MISRKGAVQRWLLLAVALIIGALLPTQTGINTQLRQFVGGPIRSALVSVTVSSLTLTLIVLLRGSRDGPLVLTQAPWWNYIGGVLGVGVVTGSLLLAPRLGAAALTAGVICGQLIAALALDHFGLLGYAMTPLTPQRVAGATLLLAALYLLQS